MPGAFGRATAPARAAASAARWTRRAFDQNQLMSMTIAIISSRTNVAAAKMTTTWPRDRDGRATPSGNASRVRIDAPYGSWNGLMAMTVRSVIVSWLPLHRSSAPIGVIEL